MYKYILILITLISCSGKKPGVREISKNPGYWYQQPLRILQTVLRQPDAENYNADSVIVYMEKTHANVLVINGGGVVDFFRNTLPLSNINKYMGSRDLLEEIVKACHRKNFKVIARVDFRGVEKDRYVQHPEWFARDESGGPIKLNYTSPELYAPCYNSYYRNEHAVEFISLLLSKYQVDGIWHNAVNFSQTCYCDRCKKQYFEFCGKKIPTRVSPKPDWDMYYQWKSKDASQQLELMRQTVKKAGPDKAYAAEVFDMFDVEQQKETGIDLYSAARYFDFLVTVSFITENSNDIRYKDLSYASEIVRFLKALDPAKSPVILFGGNGTEHRYTYAAPVDLRQWLWEAAGTGGGCWNCYFNGPYPSATLDKRNAWLAGDAYNYIAENSSGIRDLLPVQDVTVFYSKQSAGVLGDKNFANPMKGILKLLHDHHFQYGFITDFNLSNASFDSCKILILPDVVVLKKEQSDLIRDWVKQGGKLIATYETSLYSEEYLRNKDFALSDAFGCHFTGRVADTRVDDYQEIITRNDLMKGFDKTILLQNGDSTLICTMDSDAVMVTGYLPEIMNQPPENAFPESWNTKNPVVVYHKFGQGKVIYFANQPDALYYATGHPDYSDLLSNALNLLLNDHGTLITNAPSGVHVYLNRDKNIPGRYQLSLINTVSGPYRPVPELIPVRNIELQFSFPIVHCKWLNNNRGSFTIRGNQLILNNLDDFASLEIWTGKVR